MKKEGVELLQKVEKALHELDSYLIKGDTPYLTISEGLNLCRVLGNFQERITNYCVDYTKDKDYMNILEKERGD